MQSMHHEEFWNSHTRYHRERLEREAVAGRLWLAQIVSRWAARLSAWEGRLEPSFYERPAPTFAGYLERSN